jgi:hypothetical protein
LVSEAHACHRYIAGWYVDSSDDIHGFLYENYNTPATWTTLDYNDGVIVAVKTKAYGVNKYGNTVGAYWDDNGDVHGFIYTKSSGVYETLDYPNSTSTRLWAINNDGDIVGTYCDSNEVAHGFFYNSSLEEFIGCDKPFITRAYGVNDADEVVGYYNNDTKIRGFHSDSDFDNIDKIHFPDAKRTKALEINNSGFGSKIVGRYVDTNDVTRGFVYDWSTYTSYENENMVSTTFVGINDEGHIIALCTDSNGDVHSFIYDLALDTYTEIEYPDAEETYAHGLATSY